MTTDPKPTPALPACPCGKPAEDGYHEAYSTDSSYHYIGCTECGLRIPYDENSRHQESHASRIAVLKRWNAIPRPPLPVEGAPTSVEIEAMCERDESPLSFERLAPAAMEVEGGNALEFACRWFEGMGDYHDQVDRKQGNILAARVRRLLEENKGEPRLWDAETIKEAPPCLAWWLWHVTLNKWEFHSWMNTQIEAENIKAHVCSYLLDGYYSHAVAVEKPQPPAAPVKGA